MAPPRLAIICNSYGPQSHGDCIATKLLEGLAFRDRTDPPRCKVAGMYLVETARDDIGREMSVKHNMPLFNSVAQLLCLGGDTLAVDGVVVIGEHGTYPRNAKGQQLYPRREYFDQVVGVFRQSKRVVPMFNDKHLSWNWPWAHYMWQTARELRIPYMAGSSLPYAPFEPLAPLPRGGKLDHVIAVGYGGLESYGFHALETGQFVVEHRPGGETGIRSVQCLEGDDVWKAHAEGRWPRDIAAAALAAVREPKGRPEDYTRNVYAFDLEYRDGQRMTVFMANGYCQEFAFAYRPRGAGQIIAASYKLDPGPRRMHFSAMMRSVEDMFLTGRPTEPVERTVLTTGALAYLIESHSQQGKRIETPDLDIRYRAPRRPEGWKEVCR